MSTEVDETTAAVPDARAAAASSDPMVAALLRERDGYVQLGLEDRVAQVDEQLRLRDYSPPAAEGDGGKEPRNDPPKDPKTPAKRQQQTRA